MELYKKLAVIRCFTRRDVVRLTGSENAARWQIYNYLTKGYIERVRRDLYAVISLETGRAVPNKFQIAASVSDRAYISHHSAFEFYGYGNQVFCEVCFASPSRVSAFEYDGIYYLPVAWRGDIGVENAGNGVRVTSPERTVIDSIADFEKIGGLEELLRCMLMIPSLDAGKLLASLELYHHGQLYQKAGYILEMFKKEMSIPDSFLDECESRISESKTYIFHKRSDFILHKRWKLFAPADLRSVIDKGVTDYAAV